VKRNLALLLQMVAALVPMEKKNVEPLTVMLVIALRCAVMNFLKKHAMEISERFAHRFQRVAVRVQRV